MAEVCQYVNAISRTIKAGSYDVLEQTSDYQLFKYDHVHESNWFITYGY
jgi:hypothetical protein